MPRRNNTTRRSNKRNGNRPKTTCWHGEHPIRGKVYVWGNGHKVCKKCYGILCRKFITGANLRKKLMRANNSSQKKGFFARLFGL